jgi:hypothetical protein
MAGIDDSPLAEMAASQQLIDEESAHVQQSSQLKKRKRKSKSSAQVGAAALAAPTLDQAGVANQDTPLSKKRKPAPDRSPEGDGELDSFHLASTESEHRPAEPSDEEEEPILASDLLKALKARRAKQAQTEGSGAAESQISPTRVVESSASAEKNTECDMDAEMVSPQVKKKRKKTSDQNVNQICHPEGPDQIEEQAEQAVDDDDDKAEHSLPEKKRRSKGHGSTLKLRARDDLLEQTRTVRKSIETSVEASNTGTARAPGAHFELANERLLNDPLELRKAGEFSKDEEELLRRYIASYKLKNDISVPELVALIQFTRPHQYDTSDSYVELRAQKIHVAHIMTFWKGLYKVLPMRTSDKKKSGTTSIQRHVRRRYHNSKRSGGWTAEEDDILKALFDTYPRQWKKISEIMANRSATDCRDRWRDYVQYGENRNVKMWCPEEVERLESAVRDVIKEVKEESGEGGLSEVDESTTVDISWQAVSQKMGGTRSRLQCSKKWKQMQSSAETKD